MGLSQILSLCLGSFPMDVSGQILFLAHRQEMEKAYGNYLNYAKESNAHDFQLLGQAATELLKQGSESKDPETRLLSIFGAGVSLSSELLPVLEKGLFSADEKTQAVSVHYLERLHDDEADRLLVEALSSPFLLTRLEALLVLAKRNHPDVLSHLQALMFKIPKILHVVLPQIVVHLDGPDAHSFMRQLLNDHEVEVRVETILTIAKKGRDEFLPQIRALAKCPNIREQECATYALGKLKDTLSYPLLEELSQSSYPCIRLAALLSLYELGKKEAFIPIEKEALGGNLFAIALLGEIKEGKETLEKLISHEDRDVRLNAVFSLLQMHVMPNTEEFLLTSPKDLGFFPSHSPGGALTVWKTIPSHHQKKKAFPGIEAKTLAFKEKFLILSLETPEEDFLKLANLLLDKNESDLIPLLMELLKNRKNEKIVSLLKEKKSLSSSINIKNYCTLTLYKMKEEGNYEEELIQWIFQTKEHPLIQFRDQAKEKEELHPDQTSRFLVEAFETLAASQNQRAIEALIHAIAYGNPKNRYALAGLLIKAIE